MSSLLFETTVHYTVQNRQQRYSRLHRRRLRARDITQNALAA
jgi:hypothetical protein